MSLSKTLGVIMYFCVINLGISQELKGNITGKVLTQDNKPAAFVNVIVKNTNKGTITDENGMYKINSITAGKHVVRFSLLGLETKSLDAVVEATKLTQLEPVVLQVSEEQLQEVVLEVKRRNKFDQKSTEYVARLPLKNIENPQVYSVITGELLEELQVTDIQSTLQNSPGISNVMQGIGSGGVGVSLFLRGFSADIATRNGIATAFRTSTDQANVERIEVIKGPSSTLFGTSPSASYGGVVNLVTKKPFESFGGSVSYLTGSNSLSRLSVDINAPLNEDKTLLFRLNGAKHNEHSFQDAGLARNWFLAPALTYKASDRLTLNIEAEIYGSKAPSVYFNPGGAGISSMDELKYNFEHSYGSDYLNNDISTYNVFANAEYKMSDNWVSKTIVASSNADNSTHYLFLDFTDNENAERRIMNIESQFTVTQIQQNFIGKFNIGSIKNKLVVGADYYDLKTPYTRTQMVYDTIGFSNPTPVFNLKKYETRLGETDAFRIGKRDQYSLNFYASNVFSFTDRFSLLASLRVDNFKDRNRGRDGKEGYSQTYLSPKFGAVYQVVQDKVSVFANYMNGFKNIAPDFIGNKRVDLNPEFATQIEGGVKAELFNGKLNTTVSYYDITINDAVRWVNNKGAWSQLQDGEKKSKGFEVELIANPSKGWNIVAGYAYNDSEFIEGDESIIGNKPAATPENTLNFWSSYKIPTKSLEGLGFGFGVIHTDESYLDDRNTLLSPKSTVFNSAIFLDKPTFRVGVKFNNFTNEKYWSNMGMYVQPQKNRNIVASFTYKF